MRKRTTVVLILGLVAFIGLSVNYFVSHYGSITYQWKANLKDYREYNLLGNTTLSGYIKANGNVSVYILTKETSRSSGKASHSTTTSHGSTSGKLNLTT